MLDGGVCDQKFLLVEAAIWIWNMKWSKLLKQLSWEFSPRMSLHSNHKTETCIQTALFSFNGTQRRKIWLFEHTPKSFSEKKKRNLTRFFWGKLLQKNSRPKFYQNSSLKINVTWKLIVFGPSWFQPIEQKRRLFKIKVLSNYKFSRKMR